MLSGGDEIGRTQRGNNNAYCQDNELSWHDWRLDGRRRALLAFTRQLIALRRDHPVLRRRQFFYGRRDPWLRGQGPVVVPPRRAGDDGDDWQNAFTRASACGWPATPSTRWTSAASGSSTTRC